MSDLHPEERAALPVIVDFIRSLGIEVRTGSLDSPGFLPGILIHDGALIYDPEVSFHPGDLLHEAGHLALLEPEKRRRAAGDLTRQFPEEEGSELPVILWTFLVCRHLELSPAVVFHEEGYKGESAWLRDELEGGNYLGLPLLQWMGVVRAGPDGDLEVTSWVRG